MHATNTYRIIRPAELADMLGVSQSTLFDWTNPKSKRYVPDFPKRLRHGHNCTGWRSDEIYAYLEACREEGS